MGLTLVSGTSCHICASFMPHNSSQCIVRILRAQIYDLSFYLKDGFFNSMFCCKIYVPYFVNAFISLGPEQFFFPKSCPISPDSPLSNPHYPILILSIGHKANKDAGTSWYHYKCTINHNHMDTISFVLLIKRFQSVNRPQFKRNCLI